MKENIWRALTMLFVRVANDSDFVQVIGMDEGVDFPIWYFIVQHSFDLTHLKCYL